jgi:hypothetical protein
MKKLFPLLFAGLLLATTACQDGHDVVPDQKKKAEAPSTSHYLTPSGRDINK